MEFYFALPENISDESVLLDAFEAKHLLGSMRKKIGDEITIIDGIGNEYRCRIDTVKPELKAGIIQSRTHPRQTTRLGLACAFIKPARLDFVLEKGTELGVTEFHIFRSRYANYFTANQEKYRKILRQAIKQSRQFFLPELYLYPDLSSFIKQVSPVAEKFIAVDETHPSLLGRLLSMRNSNPSDDVVLVIGPEGGFEESELKLFEGSGYLPVSLGASRLRAETAAISGFTILKSFSDHITQGVV